MQYFQRHYDRTEANNTYAPERKISHTSQQNFETTTHQQTVSINDVHDALIDFKFFFRLAIRLMTSE